MFCLLVALCFGEKLDEEQIKEIRDIQYSLLLLFTRFNFFGFLPRVAKVVFRKKWDKIVGIRRRQAEIFTPLIRARKEGNSKLKRTNKLGDLGDQIFVPYCYVDSLLDVEIPEEGGRKLSEEEVVNLCHELLSGGTDTTSNGLEWIMAEVVKNQEIQKELAEEVGRAIPASEDEIKEEDLKKMPYLKAVIMEGLRRHPPGHFVLPHRASQDVELNKYLIPRGSEVHVNVAQLGWDERVWEDPMDFRPERFMRGGDFSGEVVDVTGSREIKMAPFGAGRRICPGYGLAILHLEYFLANLVREFEWKAVEGEEIDLSEEFEFTVMMKKPLRARIFPRGSKL
ncbi:uncharacterized protein A4U43_C04F16410 [Asparagus officinalis]|uniref:Cytochrome P450 n=1 Tax=Asparagus officinalis TaxID=4686 RepID=A0A5P1F6P2_ASPOF|nr:cytochrome P450 89A2-like [Asparagus officinalis]ONK72160.1 uncharacterized protein A4U43_C04F16410 [Asparagus officinalis]